MAKLRATLEALPDPQETGGRALFINLNDGPVPRMNPRGLAIEMRPRERRFTIHDRQRDFQPGSEQPADPRQIAADPRQIERDIAAFEPPQQQPTVAPINEEQLRIARYLMRFGKEVYAMTYNELKADVNFLVRRIENGTKLEEGEIDRLATYIMRLEQIGATSQ